MKLILFSKTIWVGIIEIVLGILSYIKGELLLGNTLTVSGILMVILRLVTREEVGF